VAERVCATVLLIALLPLLAAITAVTYVLSGRSPLIAHRRVGQHGCELWVWKFRTMWGRRGSYSVALTEYIADEHGPAQKSSCDARVTSAFARFCRRHSVDELPQLMNVIRGEMALVGPRPVTLREMREIFGTAATEVVQVKPGLTGLWQVSGRNRLSTIQRRDLDLEMIRRRSLSSYILVLLRTFPEAIGGSNSW
jgi:exopolysaccharide production protein ExoY